MQVSRRLKRTVTALSAVGVLSGAVIAGSAGMASASTIQNGHIQICAQGDYPAFIHVLSEPVPNSGGETTESLESPVQSPGSCWWTPFNTLGQWVQVDVVGLHSDGSQFYIHSYWWNSSTGIGIGAEGDQWSPWTQTW
jgi:hypothetical protein